MEVIYALAAEMMMLGAMVPDRATARERLERAIASGAAAEKFKEIIEAQGGNPAVVDDPALMPQAEAIELFRASRRGFVAQIEPRAVGRGIIALGGGRTTMEDALDPGVGFVITAKPGDWVEAGEPIASVFAKDEAGLRAGAAALREAIRIGDEAEPPLPLISHRVTAGGVVEVYDGM
jgi:thymidine phosphorylase